MATLFIGGHGSSSRRPYLSLYEIIGRAERRAWWWGAYVERLQLQCNGTANGCIRRHRAVMLPTGHATIGGGWSCNRRLA